MRAYEDLVTSLRYCAEYDCTTVCPRAGTGNGCITRLKKEAADAIEDLIVALTASNKVIAKSKPKWISVEERLPEDRHDVLVYAGVPFPYITVGYYDGIWKFSYSDVEIAGGANYWMPLPEPPKEDKPCQS